jgi:hypothetical protein
MSERIQAMYRKHYVYRTNDGWWLYEVWYGKALSVIGRADTRERAEQLAWRV